MIALLKRMLGIAPPPSADPALLDLSESSYRDEAGRLHVLL